MNETNGEGAILTSRRICRTFLRDGDPLLELDARLPEIKGAALMNAYYARLFRRLAGFCAEELVPDLPTRDDPLKLDLEYQVRLMTPGILSLTLELFRRDGRSIAAARFGAVWSRAAGVPLPLRAFFPKTVGLRRRLRSWIRAEALERLRSGFCLYDPRQADRAGSLFSPQNFYAAERGLVLFLPPLTLGSASEGIPEFLLPWDPAGPRLPEN
ncbi:MAG: DUF3298 domain-containing protein [Oscillospiraceae bacterium]|nr:DUF3298 domain-containing protein [Oscillospiraceae bacterium]